MQRPLQCLVPRPLGGGGGGTPIWVCAALKGMVLELLQSEIGLYFAFLVWNRV